MKLLAIRFLRTVKWYISAFKRNSSLSETDYILSTSANKKRLEESVEQLKSGIPIRKGFD